MEPRHHHVSKGQLLVAATMQSRQLISFDVSPPRTQISTYKRLKLCINILLRFSAHSDLKRLPYKMNSFPSAATWSLFIAWSLLARVHERDGDQEGALPTPRAYRPCRRSHPRPSAHVSTLGLIKAARGDQCFQVVQSNLVAMGPTRTINHD